MSDLQLATLLATLSKAALLPSLLIPETFTPRVQLSVSFNNKAVNAGNLMRASECKVAPIVNFTPEVHASTETKYTLMLVDPDAPTPDDPKFVYWRHWIVSSIPASASSQAPDGNVVDAGKALTEYLGPGPKDESQPHRYLFLLYREPEAMKTLTKSDAGGEEFVQRRSFAVKEWVEMHGMELVGVNWMLGAGDGWNGGRDEL